ncbi:VID27 cytoplasmic protein [Pterulicium gracile]|uniref:VID27 cytoplasmic protein n=1 Tax=Pterulicium gracile TaxID=1884261 RepID=A0A5C3QGU0_9AGAR|nr:VID27 cytoplasmic protein [Pterula gracilis]
MNIFKSLIGRVWHDPNAAEVVKISTGQLYILRPGNIRTPKECIFNEAMATIRRVPNLDHNFQLVVTKVFEEGDEELLEDEEETDAERVFLISEELEFRAGDNDGEPHFIWRDLEGDIDEFYQFVAPGTNAPTKAFFETCMYRAMYERKYKRNADATQDGDLEEFIWRAPSPSKRSALAKKQPKRISQEAAPLESALASIPSRTTLKSAQSPAKSPAKSPQKQTPGTTTLSEDEAELYVWVPETEEFNLEETVIAKIIKRDNSFDYYLTARNDKDQLFAHKVSGEMNQRFSRRMQSLTWNTLEDRQQKSWLLRFNEEPAYDSILHAFSQAVWETLHQVSYEKTKPEERSYYNSAHEDVEMRDVQGEEDDEDEVNSELDPDEEADSDSEQEDDDDQLGDLPPALAKGEKNSQLTVGYKGDSYVVRGASLGRFEHDGTNVDYKGTIDNIKTTKGQSFKPKHIMLHDQDRKMIMMNPAEPNSLYHLDVTTGKVVEEWKIHDDVPVLNIAPDSKFAQTTPQETFVGTSGNAVFRVDPRVSGNKMVESQFKQYTGKNQFSGVTTTAKGGLAVASEKGDIRLFDSIGKNAKTALPPLGDPILGVDVTADGRYIVATTKTYLLLIDTLIGEGRYQGQLGFDRSFPASAKPVPARLQLRSEHVAYMNHGISFSPARFNTGPDLVENAIVTSTGPFIVAWNFSKVKKGQLDRYEIKKYEENVVQDSFKFGDDKEIIVALGNNVLNINKKNLKRPTRQSLGGPLRGTRNSIVNAPY